LVESEESRSEIALAPTIDESSIDRSINELFRLAQERFMSLTSEERGLSAATGGSDGL
tara:strand:- start:1828 stop:2001 length:174 start_codon:yes stop_codon:yes gene_type:complete